MDFNLKQWRNQHESDQEQHGGNQSAPAKMPKLLLDPSSESPSSASAAALSLFVPEQQPQPSSTKLSAFPDICSTTTSPKFSSRMGSFFSLAQWQELELQALIFRYFLAGASVPAELLVPIRKSLVSSSSYIPHFHHLHHYTQYQQSRYWGRAAIDPEPGRCRRTDGKKWRCSRDVVVGHKYCERHMHRGRNRSRKPVEIPAPPTANPSGTSSLGGGGALKSSRSYLASPYRLSGGLGTSPAIDVPNVNQRSSISISENKSLLGESMNKKIAAANDQEGSDSHVLRHFFDDWPRSLQELENSSSNSDSLASSISLSMSIPGNQASDVSLKLSTGSGEPPNALQETSRGERERMQLNWMAQWGQHQAGQMGGPLAEALRSSVTANSSPTSVLHDC